MTVEWLARLASLAIVTWLLVGSLRSPDSTGDVVDVELSRQALARLGAAAPERLHLRMTGTPGATERAWAAAFARAGTAVTWSGDELVPLALAGAAVPDPHGGFRVTMVAADERTMALSDDAGLIDTVSLDGGAASVFLAGGVGVLAASAGDGAARIALPEETPPRGALILGTAGWESRFIIAALEERGWRVAARLGVAPEVFVTQGAVLAPDTGRYSVVVAVDSTAASDASAIARFVQRGGGLVLVGNAASSPALRALAAALPGPRVPPAPGTPPDSAPRSALGARPLVRLTSDAIPLERRGAQVMAAARRVGAGRVAQIAYEDSWRWRMGAGDGAVEAHRDWWSRVASSVAYAPLTVSAMEIAADSLDAAPYTRLVAALGPPGDPPVRRAVQAGISPWWAMLALLVLLLGEWSSRRLRGAR